MNFELYNEENHTHNMLSLCSSHLNKIIYLFLGQSFVHVSNKNVLLCHCMQYCALSESDVQSTSHFKSLENISFKIALITSPMCKIFLLLQSLVKGDMYQHPINVHNSSNILVIHNMHYLTTCDPI